jgi:hypothetical protein
MHVSAKFSARRFTPGNYISSHKIRSLGGPQNLSGHFGEDRNLVPFQGLESRTVEPVAQSLHSPYHTDSVYPYYAFLIAYFFRGMSWV